MNNNSEINSLQKEYVELRYKFLELKQKQTENRKKKFLIFDFFSFIILLFVLFIVFFGYGHKLNYTIEAIGIFALFYAALRILLYEYIDATNSHNKNINNLISNMLDHRRQIIEKSIPGLTISNLPANDDVYHTISYIDNGNKKWVRVMFSREDGHVSLENF